MYFFERAHTARRVWVCATVCRKLIHFLSAVVVVVPPQPCFSPVARSPAPRLPSGPLSPHYLKEQLRATGWTMGIELNANFLLSK